MWGPSLQDPPLSVVRSEMSCGLLVGQKVPIMVSTVSYSQLRKDSNVFEG